METRTDTGAPVDATEVKTCCAAAYSSDWARLLLGESFHPGGLALTERLGELIGLSAGLRVLDVASGKGASAIHLAQRFGCEIVGVDYSAESIAAASDAALSAGVAHIVSFQQGDAERLKDFETEFDAVICECAFCTFPDKPTAAAEFARVLKPGGRVGLSDLTRSGPMPPELTGLLAWISCIADAQPLAEYSRHLAEAGLAPDMVEEHDGALANLVHDIRGKLLGAELLVKLRQIELPTVDFEQARAMARAAADAVNARRFGYAIVTATKRS